MFIPLVGGLALLGAVPAGTSAARRPSDAAAAAVPPRNFAVGNLATLLIYGGLGAATFFVTIFLQQVGGYSPIAAGLSLLSNT